MKVYAKVGTLILGLTVAAGLAAGSAHAAPGMHEPGRAGVSVLHGAGHSVQLDFNPQPDPPGRHPQLDSLNFSLRP